MKKVIFKNDWNKILSINMRNCFQITKNIEENASRKRNSVLLNQKENKST